MRSLPILVTLLASLLSIPSHGQKASSLGDRVARIENNLSPVLQIKNEEVPRYNLSQRLKELGIPGLSIAVVSSGRVEWAKGYGMADVSDGRKVDTDTLFLAGSISKPVSALRIHQLSELGTVDLDTNVNSYLTSWKLPDNEFTTDEKVTLHRILNHTAGLTVWGFPGYDKGDKIPTVAEVLDGKGNTDPVRVFKVPGESWLYSGGGYTIMQLLVADVEKADFEVVMKQEVLNPLGMTDSTFENPLPVKYHHLAATGYRANGNEVEGKWPVYPEMAAAGLWTTPSQLIRYAIGIQEIARGRADGILKMETVAAMLTPGMNGHGLGPTISEHTFGHNGADEGFRAMLVAWKDSPHAVVVMVNSDNGSILQELLLSIATEYELPGFNPDVRSVIVIPPAERLKYTGTYSIPDVGVVELRIKDNGLESVAPFLDEPGYIVSASRTIFFDRRSGDTIKFTLDGDSVTGFETQGLLGSKLD